jgi:hypothetical protein
MQKIDEGAEVCPGETPADAVYLLKKSVHFDRPEDNLNVIRRESDTEQQFLKQLHKSLQGSQERRRHVAHQRRNKYLVCFKMSRKAAPANFAAEQCTCAHLCQKHYMKDAAQSSSFEFAKVNAAATTTANNNGFRSNILRIFRQFNLKNQCCCQ